MDEYEYEHTKQFEGIYTSEEIKLNKELYDECMKANIDFALVENLLKRGADPLGAIAETGWGLLIHVYGEVAFESRENNSVNLPKITRLFLKYGMDMANPKIPYDDDNSLHPLRFYPFNENAVSSLKILLDGGVGADDVGKLWAGEVFDQINVCNDDPNGEFNERFICLFKMMMLIASYDYILENNEDLSKFIGCHYNEYDLHKFKDTNNFYYEFDTSLCERFPELYRCIIRIYEKESNKQVWKIGVSLKEEEF